METGEVVLFIRLLTHLTDSLEARNWLRSLTNCLKRIPKIGWHIKRLVTLLTPYSLTPLRIHIANCTIHVYFPGYIFTSTMLTVIISLPRALGNQSRRIPVSTLSVWASEPLSLWQLRAMHRLRERILYVQILNLNNSNPNSNCKQCIDCGKEIHMALEDGWSITLCH